jgi:hypothetical protein
LQTTCIPPNQSQVGLTEQDESSGEVNIASREDEASPVQNQKAFMHNGQYQSIKQRSMDETEGL